MPRPLKHRAPRRLTQRTACSTTVLAGVAAVATSSGMAAQFLAVVTICQKGDNIVSSSNLYGALWAVHLPVLPAGLTTGVVR